MASYKLTPDLTARLGRRVRAWLVLRDMTTADLAAKLGSSRFHLSHVLNGKVAMSPEMAIRLCQFTGLTPDGCDVHGPQEARHG